LGLDGHQLPLPRHPFVLASLAWTCGAASISRQQQASSTPVSLRLLGATRQSGMLLLLPGMVWCGVRAQSIFVFCFRRYCYSLKTAIRCPCYCRFASNYVIQLNIFTHCLRCNRDILHMILEWNLILVRRHIWISR
jgi:hypothetical protein